MDYSYMVVAFIEDFPEGMVLEPPKHAHITIKKKFKLQNINESELVANLKGIHKLQIPRKLKLGDSKLYGNNQFMIIEVENFKEWQHLHHQFIELLKDSTVSRDVHLETDKYFPHVTWKFQGHEMFDPKTYINKDFAIKSLYLIQRIHPEKSIARIISKFS